MGPGETWRFGLVDLSKAENGRSGESERIGNKGLKKLAGITHGDRVRHHGLWRFQILFGRQPRPCVTQLAMYDCALQDRRTRADVVYAAIVIECKHAGGHQHELKAAGRKVKMEIGRAGVDAVNWQICRDLL